MKFSIEVKELRKAIEPCARIVSGKQFIPILANVLIDAGDGEIAFTCSDLDQVIRMKCAADVQSPGRTTVSAARMNDIARNLPDGAIVTGEMKDGSLEVKSGRSRFVLRSLPAGDYPTAKTEEFTSVLSLTPSALTKLFACAYAAETNVTTRAYLTGVCFASAGDEIHAVSTDGHRLALHKMDGNQRFPTVIIPGKAVKEFVRLAAPFGDTSDIRFSVSPNIVGFSCGNVSMTTKLIDGTFPDYKRLLPNEFIAKATVNKDAMLSAIGRTSLIGEGSSSIKVEFKDGKCCLSSVSADNGEAYDEFEAEADKDVSAFFAADLLSQAAASFPDGSIHMSFTDSMAFLVPAGNDDQSAIVMTRSF